MGPRRVTRSGQSGQGIWPVQRLYVLITNVLAVVFLVVLVGWMLTALGQRDDVIGKALHRR